MSPHAQASFESLIDHGIPLQQISNGSHAQSPDFQSPDSRSPETSHCDAPKNRSHLRHAPIDEIHDTICVGFGPASLAIAVALHDALDGTDPSLKNVHGLRNGSPKVAFLEKQPHFAWHAGMLLPGAKMQITFMKDLATMRNPRSEFSFINYLHRKSRLVEFMNLNTFLPARIEYEDYMKWCASWFEEVVSYNQEVISILPEKSSDGKIKTFTVISRNHQIGQTESRRSKHVVIAAGGRPNIPKPFPTNHPKVIHSSNFSHVSSDILKDRQGSYHIAVIGNGQSAAEIFDFLHTNYPNSRTQLLIKGSALRPSDDSPFVNEIFNPSRVDCIYSQKPELRSTTLVEDKGTNYGVVRLDLLERIYETLYMQRIRHGNSGEEQTKWQHQIMPCRRVVNIEESAMRKGGVRLHVEDRSPLYFSELPGATMQTELIDVDAVFVATGYFRDLHETLLKKARHLMPGGDLEHAKWPVRRDYRVEFERSKVSEQAGVWLQGCCETTHGLSDTLLSVLATRGGEMVRAMFKN